MSNENNLNNPSLPPIFTVHDNSNSYGPLPIPIPSTTYFANSPHEAIYSYTNMIDHLININYFLNSNLLMANNIINTNNMIATEQINELKKQIEELENMLVNVNINKKDKHDSQINIDLIQKKNFNKYVIKKYYPNKKSWSIEKINNFLLKLEKIEDILELKHKWNFVRHNEKLAKLCNLIPPIEKLNRMIGLEKVKEEIFKIIIYYIQNSHTDEYLHTVITGPSGVGKTQIAKIYGDIFVRLGILQTDKFIEIKRDDIVAQYLGQTAPKTRNILESAMGGIIFLDEGYSLGNDEKRDSFAKEAIDMINQYLSERKKDFMFIIAGYEDDLENCFFSFNKGLKRRFSHWIEITKYTKQELTNILKLKIQEKGYQLDLELLTNGEKKLLEYVDKNYLVFENYAGDIEKLFNYIKYEQSFRTFKLNTPNKIITLTDLNTSIGKFKKVKTNQPPFGMYV